MSAWVISQIRTWVPILVGMVLSWVGQFGLNLYEVEGELTIVITAALAGLYYLIVRLLAEWQPWFGYLLGVNKAPEYEGAN